MHVTVRVRLRAECMQFLYIYYGMLICPKTDNVSVTTAAVFYVMLLCPASTIVLFAAVEGDHAYTVNICAIFCC